MSRKNVTIILIARTGSTRCARKVIRPFAEGKSIFEIACGKMKDLRYPYAAGVGEPELVSVAEKAGVPVFQRSSEEVTAHKPLRKIFNCVEQCNTSHAMLISPCNPFVEMEMLNKVCDDFCASEDWVSATSVVKEQNWFFSQEKKPLFPINVRHMSTADLCLYSMGNVFHLFPVDRFLKEGIYFTFETPDDPYLYEIPKNQSLDIDDEDDFELCQNVWIARKKKGTLA